MRAQRDVEHEHLGGLAGLQAAGEVLGDLDGDPRLAGDDPLREVLVAVDRPDDFDVVGVLERPQQGPALLGPAGVVDDRADVPDVGVDGVPEDEQLEDRDGHGEEQGARVPQHVQELLAGDRDRPAEADRGGHGNPR